MKVLRIISGALGAFVSLFAVAPFAVEGLLSETAPAAFASVLAAACALIALVGPFALFMAATLSEGQYTRGNRRFLLACLAVGAAVVLLSLTRMLRVGEYGFGGIALLAIACSAVVAWCIVQMKGERA